VPGVTEEYLGDTVACAHHPEIFKSQDINIRHQQTLFRLTVIPTHKVATLLTTPNVSLQGSPRRLPGGGSIGIGSLALTSVTPKRERDGAPFSSEFSASFLRAVESISVTSYLPPRSGSSLCDSAAISCRVVHLPVFNFEDLYLFAGFTPLHHAIEHGSLTSVWVTADHLAWPPTS